MKNKKGLPHGKVGLMLNMSLKFEKSQKYKREVQIGPPSPSPPLLHYQDFYELCEPPLMQTYLHLRRLGNLQGGYQ
jgi:hypothetical protein